MLKESKRIFFILTGGTLGKWQLELFGGVFRPCLTVLYNCFYLYVSLL